MPKLLGIFVVSIFLFMAGCYKEEDQLDEKQLLAKFTVEQQLCERDAKALGAEKWYLSVRKPTSFVYKVKCLVEDSNGKIVTIWEFK